MDKDYLVLAIKSLRPTAEFSYNNNDYSTVKWDVLEGTAPKIEEIESEMLRLKKVDLQAKEDREAAKTQLLTKLGITAEEAKLLLG
jgi:hypothetical protein